MILIVIDSLERYYFATRLVNAVRHEYEFAFLTSEPVAHLGLLLRGYRSVYLNRLMPIDVPDGHAADRTPYALSIEVLNGQMTEARAKRESAAIFHIASEVLRGLRVEQCVMWNGQQLVCRAVRQACTVYGVATRFIEISNLPGKLFVDSLGVNALSTISRTPRASIGCRCPTSTCMRAGCRPTSATSRCRCRRRERRSRARPCRRPTT